jgi:LmbE family N-acetylglucosaminyl deacetylase
MTLAADLHHAWRQLPQGDLNEIIGTGTCLILAPHPDDESLGCGGLIAACVAAGRAPLVVILTDGAGSHPGSQAYPAERLRAVRARETQTATAILGLPADQLVFLNQPDSVVPFRGRGFAAIVETVLAHVQPGCTAILAPWRHDPHCDHEAASLIAATVAEQAGIAHVAYPVWSWTLPPNVPIPDPPSDGWRLWIEPFLAAKRQAIQAHESQYGDLITDDPNGFRLPETLLAAFSGPFETFIDP